MRPDVDRERVLELLTAVGRRLRAAHTLYLVGGSSAALVGWRPSTRDVDLRPEPDSDELLRLLSTLKNTLDMNIELASPLDFLPELDGWRDRSPSVGAFGRLQARHLPAAGAGEARARARDRPRRRSRHACSQPREPGRAARGLRRDARQAVPRFPAVDAARFEDRLIAVAGARHA